jgi:branched-chain amino acid transport system substrate-binding protein
MMDMESLQAPALSRRSLLKAAGVLAGTLALGPITLASGAASRAEPLAVGVVLPRSTLYPRLGASLLAGLGLAAAAPAARPLRLLVEEYGTAPSAAAAAAVRLVEQGGAQLLVGAFGSAGLALLRPLLEERQIPLILATAGANLPRAALGPYVFRHTLGLWQASLAAGAWAAANLGRRAFVAASAHDGGFDALDAFQLGFEQAGGSVTGHQLSHLPGAPDGAGALPAALAAARADFVFAAYGGSEGDAFLRAYAEAGLGSRLPLLASGLLADAVAPAAGLPAITGALSWSPALAGPAASALRHGHLQATGLPADAFAALGYDTGLLIAASSGAGATLRDSIAGASVAGARGPLRVDVASGAVEAPLYLGATSWDLAGRHDTLAANLPATAALDGLAAPLLVAPKTGWLNAYLCI